MWAAFYQKHARRLLHQKQRPHRDKRQQQDVAVLYSSVIVKRPPH